MVARVGFYNSFGVDLTPIYPNVAWAGNTATSIFAAGADYEDRNILIHWVRASNGSAGAKEIHFFSNNETGPGAGNGLWPTTGANYLFSLSLAASGFVGGDSQTVEMEFPIPLLVMGGCRVGVDPVSGITYSDWGRDADVEICYTVLNSTPATASFDDLKYKYLPAYPTNGEADDVYAITPDTASTRWQQDIEIWGGMIMNYENTAASANTAKSSVYNAGTAQALAYGTLTSGTALNVDGKVGTIAIGDKVTGTDFGSGVTVSAIPAQAATTALITLSSAQTISDDSVVSFNSEIVTTMSILKGKTNAVSNVPHDFAMGTTGTITIGISPFDVQVPYGFTFTFTLSTMQIFGAGSDTNISFYPFPVYCKGTNLIDNFRITSNMASDNESRMVWFYRPVQSQGVDHEWV
jgi:hypothetical protein